MMLRSRVPTAALAISTWFGTMPAGHAQGLVPCAREHEFCRVPYPIRVIYGVPGRSTALDVRGRDIPCSNEVFGDPAPGVRKRCAYFARGFGGPGEDFGVVTWRTCARENDFCEFRGRKRVRYGAAGRFVEGTFRNGTDCDCQVRD